MTVISRTAIIPYTTEQMYQIVNNIEEYPEFVSWCKGASIRSKSQNNVQAVIKGSKMGMDFTVDIVNYLQSANLIKTNLMQKGPFQKMDIFWKFENLGVKGTRFTFEVDFEFINRFLGWTISSIIKSEANNIVKEFAKRAQKIYP